MSLISDRQSKYKSSMPHFNAVEPLLRLSGAFGTKSDCWSLGPMTTGEVLCSKTVLSLGRSDPASCPAANIGVKQGKGRAQQRAQRQIDNKSMTEPQVYFPGCRCVCVLVVMKSRGIKVKERRFCGEIRVSKRRYASLLKSDAKATHKSPHICNGQSFRFRWRLGGRRSYSCQC